MSAMSNYLENAILDDWLLGGSARTRPTSLTVRLYTTATDDASGGTEVSGGSYAATAVTFGAASGGSASNSADVTFPTATASWGTVTHLAIYDNGGNRLFHGALTASKTVGQNDVLKIPAGSLTVSLD